MPTSATGSCSRVGRRAVGRRALRGGFTLLEVMVTLLLIGIITGFAVLSVRGGSAEDRLAAEARRLAALIELHREEAILQGELRGLYFHRTGYQFMASHAPEKWTVLNDSTLLKSHELPADFTLGLWVEGQPAAFTETTTAPQVLLLPSGEITEFSVTFAAEYRRGHTLAGDPLGRLRLSVER